MGETKNKIIHIRVPDSFYDDMSVFAESKGLIISSLARMWLKERMDAEKQKLNQESRPGALLLESGNQNQ